MRFILNLSTRVTSEVQSKHNQSKYSLWHTHKEYFSGSILAGWISTCCTLLFDLIFTLVCQCVCVLVNWVSVFPLGKQKSNVQGTSGEVISSSACSMFSTWFISFLQEAFYKRIEQWKQVTMHFYWSQSALSPRFMFKPAHTVCLCLYLHNQMNIL